MKRVWVLNRGAFFAKERYLFFPVVFFFIPLGVLFGETGPTCKLCPRSFGGNEDAEEDTKSLCLPVRVLILKSSLSLEKKKARFALESTISVAHRAMREHYYECLSAFSRDIRPGCNDVWLHIV